MEINTSITPKEKVFCLGFSKTGTTSMQTAIEALGYKVCKGHWQNGHTFYLLALSVNKDYDELLRMTNYWDAFADGPWGGTDLYLKLLEKYPNAKYILTERDPEKWYTSFEKLITMFDLNLNTALSTYHQNGLWGSAYFFETVFGIKTLAGNKQKIMNTYLDYNKQVKEYFHLKDKELLILDLEKGDNWDILCPFLNCVTPNIDFPHVNKSSTNTSYISNVAPIKTKTFISKILARVRSG